MLRYDIRYVIGASKINKIATLKKISTSKQVIDLLIKYWSSYIFD